VAVAARDALARGQVERVAVIDTDLHQGNGTARIFRDDPTVFTFSIHQENLYPLKEQSDLDIGLADGTGDDEYLEKLKSGLDAVFNRFPPQFVLYVGGVDPYQKDLLGSLQLSKQGVKNRDTMVFRACRDQGCPVVAVLAGGYAADLRDTVEMHVNSYLALRNVFA
jgi:acetoin utilization deacetylase AcuC-like enzyme